MHRSVVSPPPQFLEAALAGLVAAVALFVLVVLHIRPEQASDWRWFGLLVTIVFLLVTLSARAGRRGLAALSGLLLLFWMFLVWRAFPADSFRQPEDAPLVYRGLGMPNSFWSWSYVAAPVALATWALLRWRGLTSARRGLPVVATWLVLLIIGRHVGGIAWDVVPPPYPEIPTAYTMLALYIPVPTVFSAWMTYRLLHTPWPARFPHPPVAV